MGKPKAKVNARICLACSGCITVCPEDAVSMFGGRPRVKQEKCRSCAICIRICPIGAISGEVDNI
jgi:Fe-S-cluster-containing hydrogenase component 2